MKILAIDTATERCSAALLIDGAVAERSAETPRAHADLILPMVRELLTEAGLKLADVDCVAYGRGPGAFTGVRIAIGVAQGLAYGAQKPTVGISNLAAVAQAFTDRSVRILVCMDARMNEVYSGRFVRAGSGVQVAGEERVLRPDAVAIEQGDLLVGTGFAAYPALSGGRHVPADQAHALPRARDIAVLAEAEFRAGRARPPEEAQPVYLRDQVAFVKSP